MPNHLEGQTSPYLLQHANNPVDWYPWGTDALQRARNEDKPIFLSIGYSACHWCHVMEKESFENPAIAAFLNANFISIKVDREERPDLDHIYMTAVQLLTGSGGWPMTVFLTPDLKPFYGGTYFPPVKSHGLPAFSEILRTINHLWREERDNLLRVSEKLNERLGDEASWQPVNSDKVTSSSLDRAVASLEKQYDWTNGGWGSAPKFPQPMAIEFLLLQAERGNEIALKIAVHALEAMQRGGMYDLVGGGFHRYSTDARWLVPHFEKMLTDNALLSRAYLHAWLLTGDVSFRHTAESTLDFVLREMTHPLGGFYSSLDADSEGSEGKFYLWTPSELQSIINDEDSWRFFTRVHPITEKGNFENQVILQQHASISNLSQELNISGEELLKRLDEIYLHLFQVRSPRVHPMTDDKILTSWNAFALHTLAEAARYLHREDYLAAARRNAEFLLTSLIQEGKLLRTWRDWKAQQPAYLEDHAALVIALLELYQSDPQTRWFSSAIALFEQLEARFKDPHGGYFDTAADQLDLLVRPKALQDGATPSGNALAFLAQMMVSSYESRPDLLRQVEIILNSVDNPATRYPLAFAEWLKCSDFLVGPSRQVAILHQPGTLPVEWVNSLWSRFRPRTVFAAGEPGQTVAPEMLKDRPLINLQPTAYVCYGVTCLAPATRLEEFTDQLNG